MDLVSIDNHGHEKRVLSFSVLLLLMEAVIVTLIGFMIVSYQSTPTAKLKTIDPLLVVANATEERLFDSTSDSVIDFY